VRVLSLLAGIDPPWTLTGGGALAGFHLGHRCTRDLDLFWHGQSALETRGDEVLGRLRDSGLQVDLVQGSEAFQRLRVVDGEEVLIVDLVAEPVPTVEEPAEVQLASVSILVDTPHEILVNKMCALLQRSELRDLQDVQELLSRGGDLARALGDCPIKDGGFSPLTLAWVLRGLPVETMGTVAGWEPQEVEAMAGFRDELVRRVASAAAPEG